MVRRRPDLDTSAGADDCEQLCGAIPASADESVVPLVRDLRSAPPVAGRRTQATLATLRREWARAGRRATVVVGASAVQRMRCERLVADVGSSAVAVATSRDAAKSWL